MSDPTKGGRGQKAPYQTTHYRIPEPIKPVVEQLATAYKRLIANGVDTEDLLNGVWTAISQGHWKASGSPASAEHKQLEDRITELDNTNWELEKRYSQLNELWMQSERKRGELQAELDKGITGQPSALELLAQFLKQDSTIANHLTDPNRYRDGKDLAKFKAWLESRES